MSEVEVPSLQAKEAHCPSQSLVRRLVRQKTEDIDRDRDRDKEKETIIQIWIQITQNGERKEKFTEDELPLACLSLVEKSDPEFFVGDCLVALQGVCMELERVRVAFSRLQIPDTANNDLLGDGSSGCGFELNVHAIRYDDEGLRVHSTLRFLITCYD